MLYLNYAKPIQGGNILNFFADSEKDLEAVSGGKKFIANNGTDYGVPADSSTVIITLPDKTKKTYMLSGGEWIENPGIESFINTELNPTKMSVPLIDAIESLAKKPDNYCVAPQYDEKTGFAFGEELIEIGPKTQFNGDETGASKPIPGELYIVFLPDINDFGSIMTNSVDPEILQFETPTTYICKVVETTNQDYFLINYDCTLETPEDYSNFRQYLIDEFDGLDNRHGVYDERYSSIKFAYPYNSLGQMIFFRGGFLTREKRLKTMTFSMIRIK